MKKIDSKVLIGKITKLVPHPQADKLWVVKVDIGQEGPVEVVCSATNLEVGHIVPLVPPGGRVRTEEGKLFKVKKVRIRGVESFGMMCSELELGVGEDHEGIWILPKSLEKHLGEPLVKHLEEILIRDRNTQDETGRKERCDK